jgi:uncharacterized protein (DUF1919 family)
MIPIPLSTRAKLFAKETWNYKIAPQFRRIPLRNLDFTIISNNCAAGKFGYRELGLRYNTPTVGLSFFLEDYIKFLSNLEYYLTIPIQFTGISKYPTVAKHQVALKHRYPVGVLDDVEICFMHYRTEEEAKAKWTRRAQRVNFDNLFVMLVGDQKSNIANPDPRFWAKTLIEDFKNLPIRHKVIMPKPDKPHNNVTVMVGSHEMIVKHFDIVKWLNNDYIL